MRPQVRLAGDLQDKRDDAEDAEGQPGHKQGGQHATRDADSASKPNRAGGRFVAGRLHLRLYRFDWTT